MESDQEFRRMRRVAGWVFVSFIVVIASLLAVSLLLGRFTPDYPPFFFFGWWFFIPLFFFSFFFFFRWWGWGCWWSGGRRYWNYDPATAHLRERFARREITKEQYEQMRRELEASY